MSGFIEISMLGTLAELPVEYRDNDGSLCCELTINVTTKKWIDKDGMANTDTSSHKVTVTKEGLIRGYISPFFGMGDTVLVRNATMESGKIIVSLAAGDVTRIGPSSRIPADITEIELPY